MNQTEKLNDTGEDDSTGSGSDEAAAAQNERDNVVGNVTKQCVCANPTPNAKRRKGNLIFDASFESGNLGRVNYISEIEYDLFIRPDTCNPRFRVWFYFSVENCSENQRVVFNIVNYSKTKSLYREGMTPVIKSTSRPKWQRLPSKYVFYYRCPEHYKQYVMSFAFMFDRPKDVYYFAYCYPYTYSRCQSYLDTIEAKALNFFKREVLTNSVQQRRLDLLTITDPENLAPGKTQRVICITARVHPGESPASYVCQGLIDFLISNQSEAQQLRKHTVFKIIPMLNPDGVYLGNYRSSLMGFDLNRHWHEPSAWAHPTLHAAKNLFLDMDKNPDIDIEFYVDIHSHSTLMNGFMYGNIFDDSQRFERQSIFPRIMVSNCDDFSMTKTNFNRDAVKMGTGRRYLGGAMNEDSLCYTLEVSFYGYSTPGSSNVIPYTEEAYIRLGKNFGKSFADYYRQIGVTSEKSIKTVKQRKTCRVSKEKSSSPQIGLLNGNYQNRYIE